MVSIAKPTLRTMLNDLGRLGGSIECYWKAKGTKNCECPMCECNTVEGWAIVVHFPEATGTQFIPVDQCDGDMALAMKLALETAFEIRNRMIPVDMMWVNF